MEFENFLGKLEPKNCFQEQSLAKYFGQTLFFM